ncbi:hypothetical protein SAMN06272739_1989 [Blastococcus haudaquaticus]|uniref:Uncharacterized protein n=1 Tax=Blastococcus haudaquaticus TaxID=1938745 RepID=A0A286GT00_9ACTN|nr:hypothetical protein SAMN06272739_1989 [Blastococcus haudaquaticus]
MRDVLTGTVGGRREWSAMEVRTRVLLPRDHLAVRDAARRLAGRSPC